MTENSRADRIPELDGLRGLAILLVMAFHILPQSVKLTQNSFLGLLAQSVGMGWVGVDIFFVLSGFLITSILLEARTRPHYFRNFYARRILRILPLYYLVIAIIFLALPVLSPDTASVQQPYWPYYAFYLQNWFAIPTLLTNNIRSLSLFLGPTWSLAIEEQFYLVWPCLVLLLSRRKLVFTSIAIVILSLAARLVLVQFDDGWKYLQHFIYYGSFTRFDGFSVGALIAIAFQSERWKGRLSRWAWPVLLVCLAGMIAIVLNNGNVDPLGKNYFLNTWGYTLITLGAGALLLVISTHPGPAIVPAFFRSRILAFFGKYSYSMYLIHIPITLLVYNSMQHVHRDSLKAWAFYVVVVYGLTILGSLLTWHLLEKQALKLKKYFEYPSLEG